MEQPHDQETTIVARAKRSLTWLKAKLDDVQAHANDLRIKKAKLQQDLDLVKRRGLISYLACLAMVNNSHGFEIPPSTRMGLEYGMNDLTKFNDEELEREIKFVQLELDQNWGDLDSLGVTDDSE